VTTDVPRLIDRGALRLRRDRARREDYGPDFLRARVIEDFGDRLSATLRPFPAALDLATPGVDLAAELRRRPTAERVVRAAAHVDDRGDLVCDPENLPFAAESFDLIGSSLALQFADDLPGLLAQARRALRPDGLFLAALLGGETLTELRQAFAAAEADIEGGVSPRVLPFADARALGGLLQRAGFALPVTDVDRVMVRYSDPLALMRDLRAWGATNALVERRRAPLRRATLARALESYAERFSDADGRVRATFEIVWLSGWAPHPDQQKPLRSGSAKMRLADVLGATDEAPKGGSL
jgi:SAM-dependent methyltransferase